MTALWNSGRGIRMARRSGWRRSRMNEQGRPQVLPDKSDVALVERYLEKRSEESFRALYRAKAGRMLMLAQRLCGGSGHEAEDIVQEAWIRACAALPRF